MNKLLVVSVVALLPSFMPVKNLPNSSIEAGQALRKKILVYNTAESSSLRITLTDTLSFSDFGQPLETQPC
jgi:glucosylceramidase